MWLSIICGTLVTTSHLLIRTCPGKVIAFSSFSSLSNGIIFFNFWNDSHWYHNLGVVVRAANFVKSNFMADRTFLWIRQFIG